MRLPLACSLLVLILTTAACADLGPIAEGECGNAVVEEGEDCDSYPAGACRPAGSTGACRYDCSELADGSSRDCPGGWDCGSDGICRQGSGTFALAAQLHDEGVTRVASGDFDGDGLVDLLTSSNGRWRVLFSDGAGSFGQEFGLPPSMGTPAVEHLTTDPTVDDVATLTEGIMVMRGQSDRGMQPTVYSPYLLPPGVTVRALVLSGLDTLLNDTQSGHMMMLLIGNELWKVDGEDITEVGSLELDASQLVGDVLVGPIFDHSVQSPCDEMVYAFTGESAVRLMSPCRWDGAALDWNYENTEIVDALEPVTLSGDGGQSITAFMLVDANSDGREDLLIGGEWGDPFVSYGRGNGEFHSIASEVDDLNIEADQLALPLYLQLGDNEGLGFASFPLAVGDLNADGIPDFVTDYVVMVSTPEVPIPPIEQVVYQPRYVFEGALAAEARIADFNGNGQLDVVATLSGQRELVFLNGTGGGYFAEYIIPTNGQASRLAVGDLDGDLLLDVAFREVGGLSAQPGGATGDSLSICFGNSYGAPADPLSMGRLATIDQIAAASLSYGVTDGIDDLVVLSHDADGGATSLAVLIGTSSRQLISPYALTRDVGGAPVEDFPIAVVGGEFDGVPEHRDLAAIAWMSGADGQPINDAALSLWLLPSSGEAAISASDVTATPYTGAGYVGTPLAAAVDLDGDGSDEMVALYTNWEAFGQAPGRLLVFGAEGEPGARSWQPRGPAQVLDESYGGDFGFGIGVPEPAGGPPDQGAPDEQPVEWIAYQGHVEVADVNGDGRPDLVALGMTEELEQEYQIWTNVVVFLNDGSGSLDAAQRLVLPNDVTGSPTGFTVADVDRDSDQELVILTFDGAYLADPQSPTSEWSQLDNVGGGLSLTAGDFDHDGVTDLAVGDLAGISTYLGRSFLP